MHSNHRSRYRRVSVGLIANLVAVLAIQISCAALRAGEPTAFDALPRPQDQLWLVSSRSLGCGNLPQRVANIQYWRYEREHSWLQASLDDLLAAGEENVVTTIFVHGNRISCEEAFTRGWAAYRAIVRCTDERPIRFVIWSWPSEAVHGPLNDVRLKACRTDPAAFCLAWFVDRLSPKVPVSFWGHSFGARVVSGALHLLGGGAIDGSRLDERLHPDRQPMQAVLLGAAMDKDWLLTGRCHGHALSQVASLLLVNNGCDALLKRYHLIYADHGHEQALGYTGINTAWLPATDAAKISQIDACCQVGKQHTLDVYLASSYLLARIRPYLLFTTSKTPPDSQPELASKRDVEVAANTRSE
ncbi:MAG: hypothetical protein HY288_09510 [Planctomycetia bacterium]|nr:hypothetical protein [Planctomycetia bacterium]